MNECMCVLYGIAMSQLWKGGKGMRIEHGEKCRESGKSVVERYGICD